MYGKFAYYYDRLGWAQFSRSRAKLVLDFIREQAPHAKTLLDLACGTGEFAVLMARAGIRVTGIDISRDMIRVAQRKAKQLGKNLVCFRHGDMIRFRLNGKYDLITCNYDSLNHLLSEQEVFSTFKHAFAHLAGKGAFIFDVNTISGLHNWRYQNIRQRDDSLVLIHGVFDEKSGVATLFIDGFVRSTRAAHTYTRFQETIAERGYPISTLYRLLKKAGFSRIIPVGSGAGKTANQQEKVPRVILCAWKR